MDRVKIELKPRNPGNYCVTLPDDLGSALVAYANFDRPDGNFSGLGLHLQVSPLKDCRAPNAVDAEMFYRAVALLNAAPKLLAALESLIREHDAVFAGRDDGAQDAYYNAHPGRAIAYRNARAAIAEATTHPLHDQMDAEQREYEERAESARPVEHDDDRDHLTDDNTDFGDDLDEAARAYTAGADDIDPETLQEAADHAREAAAEDRLLAGGAA